MYNYITLKISCKSLLQMYDFFCPELVTQVTVSVNKQKELGVFGTIITSQSFSYSSF